MTKLTGILCLAIAVLLGRAGVSESADYVTALREWKSIEKQRSVIFIGGTYFTEIDSKKNN